MYRIAFSVALLPAALMAQAVGASAHSTTTARANAGSSASANVSASTSADAEISTARSRGLPVAAIEHRVAEGRAKGATDAQLAASARQMRLQLESAQEAMVRAGRSHPSSDETERGAYLIERGYTGAQVEAVAKSAPNDRSLVVAFEVLTRLRERGVASERAIEQVSTKLAARASDESISALASANANANAGLGVGVGRSTATGAASATGRVNAATGAAVSGASGATSATGSVTGAVSGAVKKP